MRSRPAERALPPAEDHAARFSRQREADRSSLAEDYVELIADLLREEGEARVVDVARRMGVSHPTVIAAVARLVREGLVDTKPYRGLFLTPAGQGVAAAAKARHDLVVRFLLAIGLDLATAEADAEGLEHHVSGATLDAFARLLAEREGR